jgi:hypothetical protein
MGSDMFPAEDDGVPVIEQLAASEAIRCLKARYFRLLDTKEWRQFRLLFCAECEFDDTSTPFPDADAFVTAIAEIHASTQTVHHGHSPEIEITSAVTARAIWAMSDYVTWPPDAPPLAFGSVTKEAYGFRGYGYYKEEYRKEADSWKISRFKLSRIRIDALVDGGRSDG